MDLNLPFTTSQMTDGYLFLTIVSTKGGASNAQNTRDNGGKFIKTVTICSLP